MGKPLSKLANEYEGSVNFYAVFPLRNSNYKTINIFKKKYNMESYESILDRDQSLTKKLGATVTPEAIITDNRGEILYRGRINDAYFAPGKVRHGARNNDLRKAINQLKANKEIKNPWPKAIGCFITFYK
jgi:hypothetical protein